MERSYDVNSKLVFTAVQAVIKLSGIGVILTVIVEADFPRFDDKIENNFLQLSRDFGSVNLSVFDLLFL